MSLCRSFRRRHQRTAQLHPSRQAAPTFSFRFNLSRSALLAGSSAIAMTLMSPQLAHARMPGGVPSTSVTTVASDAAMAAAQQAAAAAQRSQDALTRATQAIQAMQAAQTTANALARQKQPLEL